MEPGTIIHPGIVESVSNDKVLVRILSQSACSSCHAKGACSISEVEEKIIEVENTRSDTWKTGQQVMVKMEQSLGLKAVFLGYVLPLIILIISVIIFLFIMKNEGAAALLAILMLVPYYTVLYLFRNQLKKQFRFRIEEAELEY
jgi:sigma-E factor negative regulatory protein RseC